MSGFNNQKPLYLQVKERIEEAILRGSLRPEEALPSIRVLAQDYQLNPITIANTIDLLEEEGVLYKKRGVGTFIAADAQSRIVRQQMNSFVDDELTAVIKKAKLYGIAEAVVSDIVKFIYGGKND